MALHVQKFAELSRYPVGLPRRIQEDGELRQAASQNRGDNALGTGGMRRRSEQREKENDVCGQRGREEGVVDVRCSERERREEDRKSDVDRRRFRHEQCKAACEQRPQDGSNDARDAASERRREVRSQHDRGRHRHPIAVLDAERSIQQRRGRERHCEPNSVLRVRRAQRKVRTQRAELVCDPREGALAAQRGAAYARSGLLTGGKGDQPPCRAQLSEDGSSIRRCVRLVRARRSFEGACSVVGTFPGIVRSAGRLRRVEGGRERRQ